MRHTLFLLERFILPIMGDLVVQDIRRADLVEWMGRVGELRREDGKPYARESFKGAWGVLRTMLRDALVLCDLERDPTLGVRFTAPGMERAVKDVLTREELNRVLTATVDESPDIALMIWLGFTTGMRYGEMTALSWSDVDVERGLIRVRKSQVAGAVGPTKTRMPRSVPIHPVVLDKLKAHREQQETKKVRGLSTGLVFPSSNGKHRLSGVLTKPLARCVKKAGVDKHVTAHTMRRTFNNLSRQAAGEIVTRSIVGHATSEMTEHYSEVTHEEKQRALVAALGTLPTMDFAGDRCWGSAQEGENPSSFVV